MKRFAMLAVMVASMMGGAATGAAKADWRSLCYGGHQAWWNPLHYVNNCGMNCEERKLQRFWHDYYNAQRRYYHNLSHLDWLTYYKNHGQCISGGGGYPGGPGPAPMQYAPVTVAPQMSWAQPQGAGYYPGMGVGQGMGGGMMPASYSPQTYPGYGVPSMGNGLMPVGY